MLVLLSQVFLAGGVGSIESRMRMEPGRGRTHSLPAFAWRAPIPAQINPTQFHKCNFVARVKLGRRARISPRAGWFDADDDDEAKRLDEYDDDDDDGFQGMWWNDPSVFPGMGAPRFFSGYRELIPGAKDEVYVDLNREVNMKNAEEDRKIRAVNYETRAINSRIDAQEEQERGIREAAREIRVENERETRDARFASRETRLEKERAKAKLGWKWEGAAKRELDRATNEGKPETDREIRERESWDVNRESREVIPGHPEANPGSKQEMQAVNSEMRDTSPDVDGARIRPREVILRPRPEQGWA